MRGMFHRARKAAAGVVVILATAAGALAAGANGFSAPDARFGDAFEIPVVLAPSTSGPRDLLRNPLDEVSGSFDFGDGITLQTGFNADVGRMLDRYASAGFDGLFYSQAMLGSPYTGLASGGSYFGLSMRLLDELDFGIAHAASSPGFNRYQLSSQAAAAAMDGRLPYDGRYTDSVLASMTWNFAKWGGLGLTASHTQEHGGVLGLSNPLANARTTALGVSAHVGFGGGWVTTASYSEGSTQLDLRPGALAPDTALHSESYGVAVAKHGLFSKNDALGVAFARPAPNFNNTAIAADSSNDLQFFGRDKLFQGTAPETDIELGYKTEFFGNSVALQANAGYQMNYGGITGKDSVSLLSKAKIKF
jgi:hypothetical protein